MKGIGSAKSQRINANRGTRPMSLNLDGKEMMLTIYTLTIVTLPSGRKFLAILENEAGANDWTYAPAGMAVIASSDVIAEASNFIADELRKHDIYRNKFILMSGNHMSVMSKFDEATWIDVVPIPELKDALDYLSSCIFQVDKLKEKGLSVKEGLLVSGQPGIGKTVSIKVALNALAGKATVISVEGVANIRQIYEMASRLSPAVVLLEDVEQIASDRASGGHVLSDLLGVLSGSSEAKDVVTIATTNFPENIDKAIGERPGRFGNHVRVPALTPDIKLRILRLYLTKHEVPAALWDEITAIFKPLLSVPTVGDHIEQFVERGVKRAIVASRTVTVADFQAGVEVIKSVAEQETRKIGIS